MILDLLSKEGGVYVGEGVVLTGHVDALRHLPYWFAFGAYTDEQGKRRI